MSASFSLIFCPLAAKADVTAPQGDMCKQDKPKAVIAIKEYDNNFLNEFLNKYLRKSLCQTWDKIKKQINYKMEIITF